MIKKYINWTTTSLVFTGAIFLASAFFYKPPVKLDKDTEKFNSLLEQTTAALVKYDNAEKKYFADNDRSAFVTGWEELKVDLDEIYRQEELLRLSGTYTARQKTHLEGLSLVINSAQAVRDFVDGDDLKTELVVKAKENLIEGLEKIKAAEL